MATRAGLRAARRRHGAGLRRAALQAVGAPSSTCRRASSSPRSTAGDAGLQALADEMAVLRPRELVVPAEFSLSTTACRRSRRSAFPTTDGRRVELRGRGRPVVPARAVPDEEPRRLRPRGAPAGGPRRRRAGPLPARHAEGRPGARPGGQLPAGVRDAASSIRSRCGTSRSSRRRPAGATGSLLDEIDRTVTAMGGRLLRQWLLRPLLSLERVRDRLDAVEDFAFKTTERGRFRDTLKSVQDLERLVARTALGSAGPRDLVALKQSLGAIPRVRMIHDEMQAPLVRSLAAELDDVPEVRAAIEAALVDEPPALARDGGFVRDGFDAALDELRAHQPVGQAGHRADGGAGARADRHRRRSRSATTACSATTSRCRSRTCTRCRPTTSASRRSPAASGTSRRRSRSTRRRCSAPTSGSSSARSRSSSACAPRSPRTRPRIQDSARALAALDALAALAETATINNYTKPHVHDGDEIQVVDGRHPVVERRSPEAFVPNDTQLNGDDAPARDPDRAEHGRQVDLPAPGGAHLPAGAGRVVRAGAAGQARARRSHLHARRRVRQHRARPVHLHGRDAGDGQHPALGDVAQPRHPRRDRPRHGDLRRPEHRVGGGRVPGHDPALAARRRSSPRTTTS